MTHEGGNGCANGRHPADARKVVHLGMPCAGEMTLGAATGFHRSTKTGKLRVELLALGSSLACCNFNRLWCWALNAAKSGRVDYFAMIHSDVEPPEFWLDDLVDELEARDLDVLGVVAPIKDPRGLTSTAVAHATGDPYRIAHRLTMREVWRLPETFTSGDVGGPLLINTGLWVCKFDPAWARQVHFTVNDRIAVDKGGDYVAQVEPEDWYFSRLLHELGLKVGCTRKVALTHRGTCGFVNDEPWGSYQYDREWAGRSFLDERPPGDWFPHDVPGWLTEEEGRELDRLAAGKVVLEVGSYCGRSTVCLARGAVSVGVVDPFDGRGTCNPGNTMATFEKSLRRHGVREKVNVMAGTSDAVLPTLPPVFQLVFIDGAHDRDSVARDAGLASAVLRPGGLLAFHDYGSEADPGVAGAVDELIAGGAELVGRVGTLAVVRPAGSPVQLEPVEG